MVTVTGRAKVDAFFRNLPGQIDTLLKGAVRAGGKVLAEEAKAQCTSDLVRDAIVVRAVEVPKGRAVWITVKKGWTKSLAGWLEFGTEAHDIRFEKARALKVSDEGFATLVHHPGAHMKQFLRPALDTKAGEAVEAAQAYINSKVKRSGIALDAGGME